MSPKLVLLSGPRAGQIFPLGAEAFSIGRHAGNVLQVSDPATSRYHCRVDPEKGGFLLRDLGSRQGTFVNGRPVREHRLEEGDLLAVGETLLLFRTREGEAGEAEPRLLADEGSFAARTTIQRHSGQPADEGLESRDFQVLLRIATALPSFDERHLQMLSALSGLAVGALAHVRQTEWLEEENRRLSESLAHDMVGESPRMKEVYRLLGRAAATDSTVLLRGESGTGRATSASSPTRWNGRSCWGKAG